MTVRLGLIGCGLISHAHARAAARTGTSVAFVACASRSIERARAWAAQYGCEAAYQDHREMLLRERLDGVVVATWPAQHRAHVLDCIDAGVRFVLCEKALTLSGADTLAVLLRAREANAVVMEGFMYRHNAVMRTLETLLPELGRVDYIQGVFNMLDPEPAQSADGSRSWRRDRDAGGGVPHDFTCYPVDAANLIAGSPPVRVRASADTSPIHGTIDRLYGLIEYENGCRAGFESSRRSVFCQSLAVSGSAARLEAPLAWTALGPVTMKLTTSPDFLAIEERAIGTKDAPVERLIDLPAFHRQLGNFAAVIDGRESPAVSARQSLRNAFVVDAALESARSGRVVDVAIPAAARDL